MPTRIKAWMKSKWGVLSLLLVLGACGVGGGKLIAFLAAPLSSSAVQVDISGSLE